MTNVSPKVGCRAVCPQEDRGMSIKKASLPSSDAPFGWYVLEVAVGTYDAPAPLDDSLWMCGLGNGAPSTEVYLCRRCAIKLGLEW